jgi:hypothetical protein
MPHKDYFEPSQAPQNLAKITNSASAKHFCRRQADRQDDSREALGRGSGGRVGLGGEGARRPKRTHVLGRQGHRSRHHPLAGSEI